jgi:hypothetical protein
MYVWVTFAKFHLVVLDEVRPCEVTFFTGLPVITAMYLLNRSF